MDINYFEDILISEIKKILKKNYFWWLVIFILPIIAFPIYTLKSQNNAVLLDSLSGSLLVLTILMVVIASSIFIDDFTHNTLQHMINYKLNITILYFMKIATCLILFLVTYFFLFFENFMLLILKEEIFIGRIEETISFKNLIIIFGNTLTISFIIVFISGVTLVVFIDKFSVALGLFIYYFGTLINGIILVKIPQLRDVIKFNPLNVLNISSQLQEKNIVSGLTTSKLFFLYSFYLCLFLILSSRIYKRRIKQF